MDSRYITLPANSSAAYYSDNKNSHFRTKLQDRLVLKDGVWEVALVDLQYPCSWDNVTEGKIYLYRNYPVTAKASSCREDDVERLAESMQGDQAPPAPVIHVRERAYYHEDDPKRPRSPEPAKSRGRRSLADTSPTKPKKRRAKLSPAAPEIFPTKLDSDVWRMLAEAAAAKRGGDVRAITSISYKSGSNDDATSFTIVRNPNPKPPTPEALSEAKRTLPTGHVHVSTSAGKGVTYRQLRDRYEISLRRGREEDPSALVARINRILEEQQLPGLRFYYDDYTNTSHFDNTGEHLLYMSDDLCNIFGFQKRWHGGVVNRAVRRTDITGGFHSIFVYSDMAAKRTVGDAQVPLLRSVPAKGGRNEMVHVTFTDRQYVRASGMDSDVVETRLTKEDGTDVGFQGGLVTLTLHLRRAF